MSDYTPGTWRYFRNVDGTFSIIPAESLIDESYADTVIAEVFTEGIADPEANARLMASAPETSDLAEIIANADGMIDRVEGRSEK